MGASVSRERVDPRRLAVAITTASGQVIRWGPNESSADRVPKGIHITTKMPGGFGTFDCGLQRVSDVTYSDLDRFAPVRVYGGGGFLTAFEGYLATRPSSRGDDMLISPSAVGWSSALKDNPNFKEIYVDRDLTQWQSASVQRKLNGAAGGFPIAWDPQVLPDTATGQPSLQTQMLGAWAQQTGCEALYGSQSGIQLGSLYYAWKKNANIAPPAGWIWTGFLSTDDTFGSFDSTGNLVAAGPGSGTLTATTPRKYAAVQLFYNVAAGGESVPYVIYWTCLAVYGTHGLTKQGTDSATSARGFFGSDVVQNIVTRTAPMLSAALTTSGGLITPTTFIIPHLAFRDPITGSDAVDHVNRFHLNDWGVYEHKQFFWQPPGGFRQWRLRLADGVKQDDDGPQIESAYNGVIVTYQDVTGVTKSVGPPGATVDQTDTSLQDLSSTNPVNAYGRTRYALLDMGGTSTPAGAIQVGVLFLATALSRPSHGQCHVTGFATDSNGRDWPAWMMRAGDTVVYEDAADKVVRTIVDTNYDHDLLTQTCTLDAPPNKLDWLLARLQVVLVPLGFGS